MAISGHPGNTRLEVHPHTTMEFVNGRTAFASRMYEELSLLIWGSRDAETLGDSRCDNYRGAVGQTGAKRQSGVRNEDDELRIPRLLRLYEFEHVNRGDYYLGCLNKYLERRRTLPSPRTWTKSNLETTARSAISAS